MTQTSHDAIVLEDESGRYFVIPAEVLEDAMVSDDAKAAVDADILDVDGFAFARARGYEFKGFISLKPSTASSKANAWPCDTLKVAWPCDTPAIKAMPQRRM